MFPPFKGFLINAKIFEGLFLIGVLYGCCSCKLVQRWGLYHRQVCTTCHGPHCNNNHLDTADHAAILTVGRTALHVMRCMQPHWLKKVHSGPNPGDGRLPPATLSWTGSSFLPLNTSHGANNPVDDRRDHHSAQIMFQKTSRCERPQYLRA